MKRKPRKHKTNVEETLDGRRDIERSIQSNLGEMPLGRAKRIDSCTPLSFYMPEELGESYVESNWCVRERTRILMAVAAKYEDDPRAALAAIALLEKYNWNAVTASGQIQDLKVTRITESDGVVTQEDVKVMRMGGLEPPRELIDIETPKEDDDGQEEEEGHEFDQDDQDGDQDEKDDPRDTGHKPPKNAFSKGLFGEGIRD